MNDRYELNKNLAQMLKAALSWTSLLPSRPKSQNRQVLPQ